MKNKIADSETKISHNHRELLDRVSKVEQTLREVLRISSENKGNIYSLAENQYKIETEIISKLLEIVKEDLKPDWVKNWRYKGKGLR